MVRRCYRKSCRLSDFRGIVHPFCGWIDSRIQNRYYNGGGIYIIFVIDHAETTACLGWVLYIFQTISVNKIYFFKIIRCLVRICNHICVCNVYGKGAVYSSYRNLDICSDLSTAGIKRIIKQISENDSQVIIIDRNSGFVKFQIGVQSDTCLLYTSPSPRD